MNLMHSGQIGPLPAIRAGNIGKVPRSFSSGWSADPDRIPASWAGALAVIPDQGRGHTPGWHPEWLNQEHAEEQKRAHKPGPHREHQSNR